MFLVMAPFAFSAQLNPMVGSTPVKIISTDDYYVVGTQKMVYAFFKNGTLATYLGTNGLSDFSIAGNRIVLTETGQQFPNVNAYSFPGFQHLWSFEPKMKVFDLNLVWQDKQTKSWKVKSTSQGFGVCSGHSFFILSPSGNPKMNFTANNDIWDFVERDGRFYLATQEGVVYVLDSQLRLLEAKEICPGYEAVNPISNKTDKTFTRSVWALSDGLAAACEDGSVYWIESGAKNVVKTYSSQVLYTTYSKLTSEMGVSGSFFQNLQLEESGDVTVAYTSDKLAAIQNEEIIWQLASTVLDLKIYNGKVYVMSGANSYGKDAIDVYDLADGALVESILVDSPSCTSSKYKIEVNGDGILIATSCEIKFVNLDGDLLWYLPRSEFLNYRKAGNVSIFFDDVGSRLFEKTQAHFVIGVEDGRLIWKYILPETLNEKGYISDVKILNSGNLSKRVALLYTEDDGKDQIIILDSETGGATHQFSATDKTYAGILDEYLLNKTLVSALKSFDWDSYDSIPWEIKVGALASARSIYGDSAVNQWLAEIAGYPADLETLEKFRSINFDDLEYLTYKPRIDAIDVCDYNGDGFDDLVISSDSYVVLRDGATGFEEILLKDSQTWRYENAINYNHSSEFTAPWYGRSYQVFCVNDVNGDNVSEFVMFDWEGNHQMVESVNGGQNYTPVWQRFMNDVWRDGIHKIKDIDGDGVEDLIVPTNQPNRPPLVHFISTLPHKTIYSASFHDFSFVEGIGDVDNDGISENALIYNEKSSFIRVFSPSYTWEYLRDNAFWSVWNRYKRMNAVAVVDDMNGDGLSDFAVPMVSNGGGGSQILFLDSQSGNPIKQVEIDEPEWESDEWSFVSDVKLVDDDLLVFTLPRMEWESESGKVCMYNITSGKVEGFFHFDGSGVTDGTLVIGTQGEVYSTDVLETDAPEVEVEENIVKINVSDKFFTNVYVDGTLSASARTDHVELRLSNGEHELAVSIVNQDGYEKIFRQDIRTFGASSLSLLNTILAVLVGAYLVMRVVKWKTQ